MNNDKQIAYFTQEIEQHPINAVAYSKRGALFHNNGEYKKAFKDLSKAIQLGQNGPTDYLFRGQVYRSDCQYGKAIADFTKAIELTMQ